ncbi:F-box/FBD/LRR-repeat protein At1g13570-like [Rutidosis leptorrhynchoides]|uniref:F-box/FBD/LRR-repeat protein At1g13570-like n=1 Tax=Rutidosis leptorrhynchoides TaxID=125765 RepID=UPI003A9A2176
MEPAFRKHKASESASVDVISRIPEDVVTNILDRLPIQYAIRTSTLSRNWRFKWTLLSLVVFDVFLYEYLQGLGGVNWYDGDNISKIFNLLKGSITKFDLYIPNGKVLAVTEIDDSVMLLSRKGIKEFKLTNMHEQPLTLSSKLFSCVKLERLTLWNCSLYPTPTFSGFPYLLHLCLYNAEYNFVFPPSAFCASDFNHISMGQLQLRVIDFHSFRCSENEI